MNIGTLMEIIEKLIGDIEAVGETRHDEDAFINLGLAQGVIDSLLCSIRKSSETKDCPQYSMQKVGKHAYRYLKNLRDWLDDILGETE